MELMGRLRRRQPRDDPSARRRESRRSSPLRPSKTTTTSPGKKHHLINGVEKDVIVHRKGATPAGHGVLGINPRFDGLARFSSSAAKAILSRSNSASHGAGRVMSRTQANKTSTGKRVNAFLREQGVTLISAGLDEVPMVYKKHPRSDGRPKRPRHCSWSIRIRGS